MSDATPAIGTSEQGIARGVLAAIAGENIELTLPHTDYRLRLRCPGASAAGLSARVGKRVRGVVEGRALRIHPASGGGLFIEPAVGEPRIIAGRVRAVEPAAARILVDVTIPMWLTTKPDQDFGVLEVGTLVNCYVESGTTFRLDQD